MQMNIKFELKPKQRPKLAEEGDFRNAKSELCSYCVWQGRSLWYSDPPEYN